VGGWEGVVTNESRDEDISVISYDIKNQKESKKSGGIKAKRTIQEKNQGSIQYPLMSLVQLHEQK
jgi:hypothetical protein